MALDRRLRPVTTITTPERLSILALACDDAHLYAGTVSGIPVWDLVTFRLRTTLSGHTGGVLCLEIAEEKGWLFSSSNDNAVWIWDTKTLSPLYTVDTASAGDVFSLAWLPALHALYMGSQDATISWIIPPKSPSTAKPSYVHTPRYDRFFDSQGPTLLVKPTNDLITRSSSASSLGSASPLPNQTVLPLRALATDGEASSASQDTRIGLLQVRPSDVKRYGHFGYVYALCLARLGTETVLVSGSGDEDVKIWSCSTDQIELKATLSGDSDAVLTLCARDATIFAGHQGGVIKIWDLETLQCIRTINAHSGDILALSVCPLDSSLYAGSASGQMSRWAKDFSHITTWDAHDGVILASRTRPSVTGLASAILSGSGDGTVKIWDITPHTVTVSPPTTGLKGTLFSLLGHFIAFRSVSSDEHREECRQGALWLKRTLEELGASASLLPGAVGRNPIVLATFKANAPNVSKRRLLFYGHYDVVKAGTADLWDSDPFRLEARNEYVYGRGVNDNKGPVLAVACAAHQLFEERALATDVVLLIEGEEEANSTGFAEAVKRHRSELGAIDVILLSNSASILGKPCVTWGLRGVIRASVEITSSLPDIHSGLSGGAVHEPLVDLSRILGGLVGTDGRTTLPSFYDTVRPLAKDEAELYAAVARSGSSVVAHSHSTDAALSLRQAWREPSISFHKVEVSGSAHATVIPSRARATISIRIVPDQSLDQIITSLHRHCEALFSALKSANKLQVRINHTADWWLGNPISKYNQALARIVHDVWGSPPLWIREGGSVTGVAMLEHELGAEAVHLPMGESSDAAHLPNERIRIVSLEVRVTSKSGFDVGQVIEPQRGMTVIRQFIEVVGKV